MLVRLSRGRGPAHRAAHAHPRRRAGRTRSGPSCSRRCGVLRTEELAAVAPLRRRGAVLRPRRTSSASRSAWRSPSRSWGREETLGDVVAVVRRAAARRDADPAARGRRRRPAPPGLRAAGGARPSAPPPIRARFPEQVAAGPAALAGAQALRRPAWADRERGRAPRRRRGHRRARPAAGHERAGAGQPGPRARTAARARARPRRRRGLRRSTLRPRSSAPGGRGPHADLLDGVDVTLPGLARRFGGGRRRALRRAQETARARPRHLRRRAAREARAPLLEDGSARCCARPRPRLGRSAEPRATRFSTGCDEEQRRLRRAAGPGPRPRASRPVADVAATLVPGQSAERDHARPRRPRTRPRRWSSVAAARAARAGRVTGAKPPPAPSPPGGRPRVRRHAVTVPRRCASHAARLATWSPAAAATPSTAPADHTLPWPAGRGGRRALAPPPGRSELDTARLRARARPPRAARGGSR